MNARFIFLAVAIIAALGLGYAFADDYLVIHTSDGEQSIALSTIDSITFTTTADTAGLIAYYPFNGNADDESGHGHNGTVSGATLTKDRDGNAESAYLLDGINNRIDLGAWRPDTTNFTICFWLKSSRLRDADFIVGDAGGSGGSFFYILHDSLVFRCDSSKVVSGHVGCPADTSHWRHFTGVYRSGVREIYEGGELIQSKRFNNMTQGRNNMMVGYDASAHGAYWSGRIDEIRVYNRALSQEEIQALSH